VGGTVRKPAITPLERRRIEQARLLASLPVPQHTKLEHGYPVKQKPASGINASV
jgi:hypothetical protein